MLNNPLISVVIITYNQEKFISQTIDCVLEQKTIYDYEIVIGEDCSTDRTLAIIREYEKKYPEKITVISSDRNVGLLQNYYRSVKAARGEFIAVCAGDDYWHVQNKLQEQCNFLIKNPQYGMVHSDTDILYEDENRYVKNYLSLLNLHRENEANNVLEKLFSGQYTIIACTTMYRKKFFDEFFNIEELNNNKIVMEDMPLWLAIAAHSKIKYINKSYIVHRAMKGTITNPTSFIKQIEIWESCRRCFIYCYELYKDKILDSTINTNRINYHFDSLIQRRAIQANDRKVIRHYYRQMVSGNCKSYITKKEVLRFYITYVPYGLKIYNFLSRISKTH